MVKSGLRRDVIPLSPQRARIVRFGLFTLDPENGELRREGDRVPLQDKPVQLLTLLVEKPGQVVTREEIRQKLWGADTFVEFDDSLNHAVRKLREALGDSAEAPRFIKTLPRQGYRFLAPLHPENTHAGNGDSATVLQEFQERSLAAVMHRGHPRRWVLLMAIGILVLFASGVLVSLPRGSPVTPASLLVLPFRSLDVVPRDDHLGEGISEQVTAKLMNLHGLRLVSPEAAYRVNSPGGPPAEAGKRLNAEAVLVGSVRTGNRKIRVNAQLIRTADGRILWADGGLEVEARDLLDAERTLAAAITSRLRVALTSRERRAMASTPTSNATAYEMFVRGKLAMRDRDHEERVRVAEQLFEQAVRLDPTFADALAWLALAQAFRFQSGSGGDELRWASIENSRKAIAIDPSVTMARRALISIFHTTGQAEEGLKEAAILRKSRRAEPVSLVAIANAYLRAGMPDRALPVYQQALEMDTEDTDTRAMLAFTAYWAGRYEVGLRAIADQSSSVAQLPRINLALATGQRDMARSAALEVMQHRMTGPGLAAFTALLLRELGERNLVNRLVRERLPAYERTMVRLRNERAQIGLGLLYSILKDKPRAREQVRLALETNPGDPWTLFFAAEIHAELGDADKAVDYLHQAYAGGFLAAQYLDWPPGPLFPLRTHPQVRAIRENLKLKIAALRKEY
jgi:DNA-binding winged helix-turn-helix (wHTH) protein/TolB-like protein/predicted Zn-dependent protease